MLKNVHYLQILDLIKRVNKMENNTDLRVVKTHKALKDALIELMNSVGFDKITVQSLTNKARVSRTTFYLHYLDKYDLLDKVENEVLSEMQKIVSPYIEQIKSLDALPTFFKNNMICIYNYVKENRDFFELIFSDKGDPAFISKFFLTVQNTVLPNFNPNYFKIPPHYAVSIIVSMQTSIIKEWLNSGMKESPEELAEMVSDIFSDIPSKLLGI